MRAPLSADDSMFKYHSYGLSAIPAIWLIALVVGFIVTEELPMRTDGEAIYLSRCMSCHQIDGNGIAGVFPPLNGTEWVVGDKGRLIRLMLDGMMGETEVNGVVYGGVMPPWKSFLTDEEVAAVLTYIRGAWDNDGSRVTPNEVALVRKATEGRKRPWSAEELNDSTNLGIPGSFSFLAVPPDTSANR